MVAYLQKSEGSEGTTTARTSANEEVELTATIDGQVKTITEASLRRHLKLEDNGGVTTLPNSEIFEQLALMGYVTDSDILLSGGPHTRTYVAHTLTQKLFSNMKRISKGYSGVDIPLFPTMLTAPESSPSRITFSPSLSPQTHPSTSQQLPTPPFMQTIHDEEPATLPHESPLHSVHSLGRDEGSLSLNELTDLYTSLSKKVGALENELQWTKKTYSTAITMLIFRVKKLEKQVKTSKARRRVRLVLSEDEDEDAEIQEKISDDTEVLLEEEEPTKIVEDQGSGEKVTTAEVS
ncbi:hypothetical protein Tco_0214517, partial [Tanacetum coccineum]